MEKSNVTVARTTAACRRRITAASAHGPCGPPRRDAHRTSRLCGNRCRNIQRFARRSAGFLCPLHHGSHIHRHGILPQHAAARPHAADDIQPVVDTIHCHGPDPRPCGVGRPHVVRRYSRGPAAAVATLVPHAARQHAICRRGGTHGPRGRRRHAVRIGGAADVLPHLRVGDGDIRHYARLDFLHLVRSRLRPTSCWHR